MSILQKQKLRDPSKGYARDFVEVVTELAPDIKERGFKVISNAGGVNPVACVFRGNIMRTNKFAILHMRRHIDGFRISTGAKTHDKQADNHQHQPNQQQPHSRTVGKVAMPTHPTHKHVGDQGQQQQE